MFDPKVAGAYLAGQALGKSAGRVEEHNKTAYEIDVLNMTVEGLGKKSRDAVFIYVITLARSKGGSALIAKLSDESVVLNGHFQRYGNVSTEDFARIAPFTVERSKSERPNARALMKSAALQSIREVDLDAFDLSPKTVERIRAAAARDVEEFYSGPY